MCQIADSVAGACVHRRVDRNRDDQVQIHWRMRLPINVIESFCSENGGSMTKHFRGCSTETSLQPQYSAAAATGPGRSRSASTGAQQRIALKKRSTHWTTISTCWSVASRVSRRFCHHVLHPRGWSPPHTHTHTSGPGAPPGRSHTRHHQAITALVPRELLSAHISLTRSRVLYGPFVSKTSFSHWRRLHAAHYTQLASFTSIIHISFNFTFSRWYCKVSEDS